MEKLTIASSARLHMTLIDLNGSLGRVDGGIGPVWKERCLIGYLTQYVN